MHNPSPRAPTSLFHNDKPSVFVHVPHICIFHLSLCYYHGYHLQTSILSEVEKNLRLEKKNNGNVRHNSLLLFLKNRSSKLTRVITWDFFTSQQRETEVTVSYLFFYFIFFKKILSKYIVLNINKI